MGTKLNQYGIEESGTKECRINLWETTFNSRA